jgi:GTPase SAR1 family protein
MITYDVSIEKSLEAAAYWVGELKNNEPDCMLFLIGNKADLPNRQVTQKHAEDFAAEHGMTWMETSAKTGENVSKIFEKIANQIVKKKAEAVES